MITTNENQLLSATKQVFAKTNRFCKADKMEQLLLEEGLTPEEAKQAIPLAKAKEEMQLCYPYIDEIHGECYCEPLADEDREIEKNQMKNS